MLITSVVLPFAAVAHRIAGYAGLRAKLAARPCVAGSLSEAVDFVPGTPA